MSNIHQFKEDIEVYDTAIRDPIWKHIWISDELQAIIRSKPFLRLQRIKQLGPTSYIYPGATHTRAAHSIGVYYVAKRLLDVLVERGASEWVTQEGKNSFLAAALLHDIGHFPFTHSLKELPLKDHEILSSINIEQEPLKTLISRYGANPYMTSRIINTETNIDCDDETKFYRKLLSGVLDPDKIDYLNRDAFYCGVPYGLQDTDFIISQVFPHKKNGITIRAKGILSVESILFSKYLMYKSVYWHRQVRIATAMMKKTLYFALKQEILAPEQLYNIDDEGLFYLLDTHDFEEKSLALNVRNHSFYKIIAEFHFHQFSNFEYNLEDLDTRFNIEKQLADRLSSLCGTTFLPIDILIDIPENISFESDLIIHEDNSKFMESTTVFTDSVVKDFTKTLRIIRVAVNPSKYNYICSIKDISEKLANCLGLR